MAQRRKLTTIVSADVVGYSRLMGDDERATLSTLKAYRDIFAQHITAHEGRVVDSPGDALLAEFPSAIEAVNCASDIQRELAGRNASLPEHRRMRFRIGVNLGDVTEQDGALYGDGVNIAARLESLAEAGGICVSGTVYDQVEGRLPVAFKFAGEQSVKNIAKPVRTYHAVLGFQGSTEDVTRGTRRAKPATARTLWLAGAAALLVGAGALGVWKYVYRAGAPAAPMTVGPAPALPLPDKPSIAVLPFVNMSDDKEQEYFSDGMTEDLITDLSKRSGLFVIARNSVFLYKGRPVKPEQVSRELGVRYVLEGSVRKAGNRVRITAQLIDATSGYHLWAEHYDSELKEIFALQDRITRQIVAALAPRLAAGEQSRSGPPETNSIEAYDNFLRGVALFYQYKREPNAKARQMLERAVALDSNYARAYVWLSWAYFIDWEFQWIEGPSALDRSLEAARKAVALDDSLAEAHTVLGWNSLWKKQNDVAIAELERAVSLDPNSEWAYGFLAEVLNFSGRADEAIGFVKKAMRLDPNYPPWLAFHLGHSYYQLQRYDDAVAALQDALRRSPDFSPAHRWLAAVYAEAGREQAARAEVAEILRISPGASLERWRQRLPYKNQADAERYIAGLRKAGLR